VGETLGELFTGVRRRSFIATPHRSYATIISPNLFAPSALGSRSAAQRAHPSTDQSSEPGRGPLRGRLAIPVSGQASANSQTARRNHGLSAIATSHCLQALQGVALLLS